MTGSKVDSDLVRELSQLLEDNNLTELEWSKDGETIRVVRNKNVVDISQFTQSTQSPISQDASKDNQDPLSDLDHPGAVNSPMVGTVYVAPEPGAEPFVKVGTKVSEGQTLLIVEAMKTMNPIPAPKAGVVTKFLVNDSSPVEFGQTLLVIE